MRFRLIYEGKLLSASSSSESNGKKDIRKKILKCFHDQLDQLWKTNSFLRAGEISGPQPESYFETKFPKLEAKLTEVESLSFQPLVRPDLHLSLSLEILLLTRNVDSGVFHDGDIDNQVKFLVDCLRVPSPEQIDSNWQGKIPRPCIMLMDNDKAITSLKVEKDTLLKPKEASSAASESIVLIDVNIKPYQLNFGNFGFG